MATQFDVIVLGSAGGLSEDNLTAYLVAPHGGQRFLAVDAGTLFAGLHKARALGSLDTINVPADSPLSVEGWVLKEGIRAYLISHAHLDHIAGLIINSTDDSAKPIFRFPATLDYLRDYIFNWKIWPNFGNEGVAPLMNKYQYIRLQAGQIQTVPDTSLQVIPFKISHSTGYESTAFLLACAGQQLLFIGDTGCDPVEKSKNLHLIWQHIAPLIQQKTLRGIFMETSYPNGRPDELLYGHLTPAWMLHELQQLAQLVDAQHPQQALSGLPVVVTSIKPSLEKYCTRDRIQHELQTLNTLGIRFIIPTQGERLGF